MVLFMWPYQITKDYKNKGLSRNKGKPKMALWVSKVPCWEGASKGGFTICDTRKLCSAENTIFIVFQQNTAWQKAEIHHKLGIACQHAKVFFVCFSLFLAFLCLFFFVEKKNLKGYFPAILEFFLLCSPKRPVFKILLFFLSCFSLFSFCLPFQKSIFFFAFCPSTPFWKRCFWGFLLSFLFVAFSFVDVCLSLRNELS